MRTRRTTVRPNENGPALLRVKLIGCLVHEEGAPPPSPSKTRLVLCQKYIRTKAILSKPESTHITSSENQRHRNIPGTGVCTITLVLVCLE